MLNGGIIAAGESYVIFGYVDGRKIRSRIVGQGMKRERAYIATLTLTESERGKDEGGRMGERARTQVRVFIRNMTLCAHDREAGKVRR
jgi:hypothetical protein